MSKPHFREITERHLSEDYDHEAPLDFDLVRVNASQQLLLTKRKSIHNWDKPEIELSHRLVSSNENDLLLREIALIKLLMNGNDPLFRSISHPLINKNLKFKKSLVQKYFQYLNSNEIWTLMSKKTNCGNTFYQCMNQANQRNETIFGFQPLDEQCYTKFQALLWPCIMDYYQVDIHTLPSRFHHENNLDYFKNSSINFSHPAIELFSIVIIRNLNNYSFRLSSNDTQIESFLNTLIQDLITQYQGQYISAEKFTKTHLQILSDSMIDHHGTMTNDRYPRGLYISSDESLLIWLMGSDHFRIISSSRTMNISNIYKKLNSYLMFIDNYLAQKNHSFAFHPKFAYLTSSIQELSGLITIAHCTILNEYHQRVLENQLEKAHDHLRYSINDPSTIVITNRPLLGLNDNEKLVRTIHAILIVLHNSQEKV